MWFARIIILAIQIFPSTALIFCLFRLSETRPLQAPERTRWWWVKKEKRRLDGIQPKRDGIESSESEWEKRKGSNQFQSNTERWSQ